VLGAGLLTGVAVIQPIAAPSSRQASTAPGHGVGPATANAAAVPGAGPTHPSRDATRTTPPTVSADPATAREVPENPPPTTGRSTRPPRRDPQPTGDPRPDPDPDPNPGPGGWRLVWHDEFEASSLSAARWNAEHLSTYGDGNNELACLMNRPANLQVADGRLTLRARREPDRLTCGTRDSRFPDGRTYSSAMITTKNTASWTYGRFEMRAKLPTQQGTSKGLWPAFWMRPVGGGTGELDIMEAIGGSGASTEWKKIHQTIWYDYAGTHPRQVDVHSFAEGSPSDGFHRYAVEWERGAIRWYVDGRLTYQRTASTTPWLDQAFAKPFYLRLNLAVGGNWPGSPDGATRFPAEYVVDWVRVYQR
jgi:beta-glucanase (GH16 family)